MTKYMVGQTIPLYGIPSITIHVLRSDVWLPLIEVPVTEVYQRIDAGEFDNSAITGCLHAALARYIDSLKVAACEEEVDETAH